MGVVFLIMVELGGVKEACHVDKYSENYIWEFRLFDLWKILWEKTAC